MVNVVVIEVDVEKECILFLIKNLVGDLFVDVVGGVKCGLIIIVEVIVIEDGGIEVEYEGMKLFICCLDLLCDCVD